MITVLMCAYNEKKEYIIKTIESVLNQTYSEFEYLIVIDNPNNKELINLIDDYSRKDGRIVYYINEKNIGLALSLNKGLSLAKFNIIARIDADDIAECDRLEKELNFFLANPTANVVSVNKTIIDENDKIISRGGRLPKHYEITKECLKYTNIVLHPGAMYCKDYIQNIGGYRNIYAAEDYDLWLRVVTQNGVILFLDEPLMRYRMAGQNITSQNAYKMWCSHRYVRSLFEQRKKMNTDDYSEKDYELYMRKHNASSENKTEKFNRSVSVFNNSRYYLKQKKRIKAFFSVLLCTVQNPYIIPFIMNSIYYKKALRKEKE